MNVVGRGSGWTRDSDEGDRDWNGEMPSESGKLKKVGDEVPYSDAARVVAMLVSQKEH